MGKTLRAMRRAEDRPVEAAVEWYLDARRLRVEVCVRLLDAEGRVSWWAGTAAEFAALLRAGQIVVSE